MSGENKVDHIDGKSKKLEDHYEKFSCFDATWRTSVVDCFINKCMEFYTKQVNNKSVRPYNTFTNTGKII